MIPTPLPVTLLSGFLGSGKTTLLQHILRNKQNLKCAVIVNDMAAINIDGALIDKSNFIQKEEKLVQLQNGCICCTLRGDLLAEVARLAEQGRFDYLVIESTGISEPMQVAETFGMSDEELEQLQEQTNGDEPLKSIQNISRLDTCVTVVDATQFFDIFETGDFLNQRYNNVDPNDERTVVDLLCEQVEFADVILINKADLVSADIVEKCELMLRRLNTRAKLIRTTYSRVDLKEILNTNLFDYEKAAMAPGWLQSLKEPLKPESEEYAITSFIYKRRLPFHPKRIHELLSSSFLTLENRADLEEDDDEMDEDDSEYEDIDEEELDEEELEEMNSEEELEDNDEEAEQKEEVEAGNLEEHCQKVLAQKKKSIFKNLLRSKGFFWLATRPYNIGEWSQAGIMLTIESGGQWFCEIPEEYWPEEEQAKEDIRKDFDDKVGDKRQEIVFIGQFEKEDKENIIKTLDNCLVTPSEWKKVQKLKMNSWEDPWEPWTFTDFDNDNNGDDVPSR